MGAAVRLVGSDHFAPTLLNTTFQIECVEQRLFVFAPRAEAHRLLDVSCGRFVIAKTVHLNHRQPGQCPHLVRDVIGFAREIIGLPEDGFRLRPFLLQPLCRAQLNEAQSRGGRAPLPRNPSYRTLVLFRPVATRRNDSMSPVCGMFDEASML